MPDDILVYTAMKILSFFAMGSFRRRCHEQRGYRKLALAFAGVAVIALPLGFRVWKAPAVQAQSLSAPHLQFEAASIKPSSAGLSGITFAVQPGGRLDVENNPISNVIKNAYGSIRPFVLQGGPDWVDSDRYDIEAKAEGNPAEPEMMVMLQALLADRFKLKVHRETRELPVYALTVAKGGPKLTKHIEGSCVIVDPNSPPPPGAPGEKPRDHCGNNLIARGRWDASKVDMPSVAGALSVLVRRKVIDKTGLTGFFDIHIDIPSDPLAGNDPGAPSIFTVLQDELGLKLDSDKGPVAVLVIDHIERPSQN
ncbi:MAG TPA: TIGR03435 family protein [Terriglobia bacterium]